MLRRSLLLAWLTDSTPHVFVAGETGRKPEVGVPGAKILTQGKPEASLISLRVHATGRDRMPPLGTRIVDAQGVALLDDWIRAAKCP